MWRLLFDTSEVDYLDQAGGSKLYSRRDVGGIVYA
jgi:hypothetical protein